MKKYIQLDMYVLTLKEQDVVTTSGFLGGEGGDTEGFGPNTPNTENTPENTNFVS